ncbi:hypothetical protein [Niveibacterium sp. SC-1]|uniref:hypothetical protein n=1 Tax=Niveibacterium sp. SC-1 TaxID=3135646 RepID=UPI00311F4452
MRLSDSLPPPYSWIARLFGWGVGLAIAIGFSFSLANGQLQRNALSCMGEAEGVSDSDNPTITHAQRMAACIDKRSVFPATLLFRDTRHLLEALPSAPCEYVGTWRAARTESVYRVVLRDDGRFEARALVDERGDGMPISGAWGVVEGRMVWLYDEGRVWPPDVNRIHPATGQLFLLDEQNGSQTSYLRTEAPTEGRCAL